MLTRRSTPTLGFTALLASPAASTLLLFMLALSSAGERQSVTPTVIISDAKMSNRTPSDARDLAHRTHQRLIGGVGLLLPPLLYLVAALRPTLPLERWELLRSISAYYYTGATGFLVGLLVALALFLISYPGYEGVAADRILGRIAGVSALDVALFPTSAPAGLVEPPWWTDSVNAIHFASAVTLLKCFAVFSLWLFRKSAIPEHEQHPPGKRLRDRIYFICGVVILAALVWAAIAPRRGAPVFWPEAAALWAFAFSWLVKGEAIKIGLDEVPSARDGVEPQSILRARCSWCHQIDFRVACVARI